jgi:hypothetical protein
MEKYFEITSGKILVSDPCYDKPTWCTATLDNVRNGTWEYSVEEIDEGRIASLEANYVSAGVILSDWEKIDQTIGVDSGQAGIFDYAQDPEQPGEYEEPGFYRDCCSATLGDEGYGTVKFGCVSSSGYGDGGYDCFVKRSDKGEILAVRLEFITEYEEDDVDCDDSDDGEALASAGRGTDEDYGGTDERL